MNGKENLKPIQTADEAKELGAKGGKASGEARRRKKSMKEAASILLSMDIEDPKVKKKLEALGIANDDMTNQMLIIISMFQKAAKGDVRAAQFLIDLAGENSSFNEQIRLKQKELDDKQDMREREFELRQTSVNNTKEFYDQGTNALEDLRHRINIKVI